jgi:hypothetical protein
VKKAVPVLWNVINCTMASVSSVAAFYNLTHGNYVIGSIYLGAVIGFNLAAHNVSMTMGIRETTAVFTKTFKRI